MKRIVIPIARRQPTRTPTGCVVCHWTPPCRFFGLLEHHHLLPRAAGGGNERANIIMLCPNHHRLAHAMFTMQGGRYFGPTDRLELMAALSNPDHYYDKARAHIQSLLR